MYWDDKELDESEGTMEVKEDSKSTHSHASPFSNHKRTKKREGREDNKRTSKAIPYRVAMKQFGIGEWGRVGIPHRRASLNCGQS